MRSPTIVDYGPRLAAIEAHRHPARVYCDRQPPDPARPFGYRCPTCRYSSTAGKVARYADGVRTLETCDRCDGRGWLFVAHPSAVPVRREYAPAFDVAAHLYGATRYDVRYDVWDAYHLTTPTPREAWTAEDRDAYKLWATGEDWRPVVWRLPHARGFLAGWRSESSGTVAWDPEIFAPDDDDPDGTECPRDAMRRARDMAERAAEEQSEDLAACEYATEEGRKDGAAGKLAEDFGASNVSRDYREVWEEARAEAYAEAAHEAGERDGRNGDPADPSEWPGDVAAYMRGFAAGRDALHAAARRVGMDYTEEAAT